MIRTSGWSTSCGHASSASCRHPYHSTVPHLLGWAACRPWRRAPPCWSGPCCWGPCAVPAALYGSDDSPGTPWVHPSGRQRGCRTGTATETPSWRQCESRVHTTSRMFWTGTSECSWLSQSWGSWWQAAARCPSLHLNHVSILQSIMPIESQFFKIFFLQSKLNKIEEQCIFMYSI